MLLPSALQFPMMNKPASVVSKQVFALNDPLSLHFVHAASVQSFSSIDFHLLPGPGGEGEGDGGFVPLAARTPVG